MIELAGFYRRPFFFFAVAATNSSGSSSPSTGGLPLPDRANIRVTFSGFARRARSSKYSCVRSAETFSAKARVINWFSATPSDSAAFRASASRLGGTRSAKLLRRIRSLLSPITVFAKELTNNVPRSQYSASPFCCRGLEIPIVERDDRIRHSVDCRFQNHFIVGIRKARTRTNLELDGPTDGR
jgi:hypothetical protein